MNGNTTADARTLSELMQKLRVCDIRAVGDSEGAIWIGRVRLDSDGQATVDGKPIAELGGALWSLAEALPAALGRATSSRPGPQAKRGRLAREAEAELILFAETAGEEIQRMSPGRWVVGRRVLYNIASGRVRPLPEGRTHPYRGLAALQQVLAETPVQLELHFSVPSSGKSDAAETAGIRPGSEGLAPKIGPFYPRPL